MCKKKNVSEVNLHIVLLSVCHLFFFSFPNKTLPDFKTCNCKTCITEQRAKDDGHARADGSCSSRFPFALLSCSERKKKKTTLLCLKGLPFVKRPR